MCSTIRITTQSEIKISSIMLLCACFDDPGKRFPNLGSAISCTAIEIMILSYEFDTPCTVIKVDPSLPKCHLRVKSHGVRRDKIYIKSDQH